MLQIPNPPLTRLLELLPELAQFKGDASAWNEKLAPASVNDLPKWLLAELDGSLSMDLDALLARVSETLRLTPQPGMVVTSEFARHLGVSARTHVYLSLGASPGEQQQAVLHLFASHRKFPFVLFVTSPERADRETINLFRGTTSGLAVLSDALALNGQELQPAPGFRIQRVLP